MTELVGDGQAGGDGGHQRDQGFRIDNGQLAAEPDRSETVTGPGERPVTTRPSFFTQQREPVGFLADLGGDDGDDVVAELFHQVRVELVHMAEHRLFTGVDGVCVEFAREAADAVHDRGGLVEPDPPGQRLGLHHRTGRQLHSGPHLAAGVTQVGPVRGMQPLARPHGVEGGGGSAGLDLGHPAGCLGTKPFQTQQQFTGACQQLTVAGAPQIL